MSALENVERAAKKMKVCCSINSHQVFAPKPEILFSALVSFRRAVNLIKVDFCRSVQFIAMVAKVFALSEQ